MTYKPIRTGDVLLLDGDTAVRVQASDHVRFMAKVREPDYDGRAPDARWVEWGRLSAFEPEGRG